MIRELQTNDFTIGQKNVQIKGIRGPGMILIHQAWCGYCVRFMPAFKDLDKRIGRLFPFVMVEGDKVHGDLVSKLVDGGFPTIKFFDKNGVISNTSYQGNRDTESLLEYICTHFHTCDKRK